LLIEQEFLPLAEKGPGDEGPIKCVVACLKRGIFGKFFEHKAAEKPIYIIIKNSESFFSFVFN